VPSFPSLLIQPFDPIVELVFFRRVNLNLVTKFGGEASGFFSILSPGVDETL
jgi:hypothetical protein